MATTVYTTEDVLLQDGTELTLKRINIAGQRKFMQAFDDLDQPADNNEALDQMIQLAQICLTALKFEKAEDRDFLEEILDEPTIYKIIEVCAGMKLNDPNLLAAAAAMAATQTGVGTA